jgi:hypothetical protein
MSKFISVSIVEDQWRPLPEPKDQKSYFSNKDEVMAFSIAKRVIAKYPNIKTPNEGIIKLTNNGFRLYAQVKMSVDARTLKDIINIYIFEDILKKIIIIIIMIKFTVLESYVNREIHLHL